MPLAQLKLDMVEIKKMILEVVRAPNKFDYYTPEDEARFLELMKIDGAVLPVSDFDEMIFESPSFASLEGVGGYVFLGDATVSAEKFTAEEFNFYREGGVVVPNRHDEPKRFFKLCIEHGENPCGATYAYAILPYATDGELAAYAEAPEVEILSNTPECQAVRKSSIGISFYVFYSAGACEDIEVTAPCIVTVSKTGGRYKVSVCDPTMKLEELQVRIERRMTPLSSDNRVEIAEGDCVELRVDTRHSVGRPYSAIFAE